MISPVSYPALPARPSLEIPENKKINTMHGIRILAGDIKMAQEIEIVDYKKHTIEILPDDHCENMDGSLKHLFSKFQTTKKLHI